MPQDLGTVFYFDWELRFLHFLQSIHNPVLDSIMLFQLRSERIYSLTSYACSGYFPKNKKDRDSDISCIIHFHTHSKLRHEAFYRKMQTLLAGTRCENANRAPS